MIPLFKRGAHGGHLHIAFYILFGLLFLPSFLSSEPKSQTDKTLKDLNFFSLPGHLLLEWSWGWHTVSDSRYREVYSVGKGMATFAVHPFFKSVGRHSFGFAAGIKSFSKEGESTVTQEDTRLTLIPIYLAGEYMLNLPPFYPGIEMGVDHCFYTEESLLMKTKGSTTGYHVQGNLIFQPPGSAFLRVKIFIRHSRLPARETFRVNLGGPEYGAGLLIKFNFARSSK
jgi:hypothetical protein